MRGLTEKQNRFLDAYKQTNNGPQSAISAGYSAKSASIEACRLLKHPAILLDIDNWRKERQKSFSKDDFVDLALKDYHSLENVEPNKPRFLQLAGQGAGIIGNTSEMRPNQTLNIVNIDTSGKNQLELWDMARKLLGND